MNFVIAGIYDTYITAHLALGRLQDENINCWLKDENMVSIYPVLTGAVGGGIKLMVAEPQMERAMALINGDKLAYQRSHACPDCHSSNIEAVSAPRKPGNWITTILNWILSIGAPLPVEKGYHCLDCGREYEMDETLPQPEPKKTGSFF